MLVSLLIGLGRGLLITKLRLQPFVVTLSGLLLYRGLARCFTNDQTLGFGEQFEGLRYLATGRPFFLPIPLMDPPIQVPMTCLIIAAPAVAAGAFPNLTI